MVWVRIDDHFDEHPKIAQLSDSAAILFVSGLAYCNRNLTDGFIPHMVGLGQLRFCGGNTTPAIRELEESGLWVKVQNGWTVHDYLIYQPSKTQVLAEREASRIRMGRSRERRRNVTGEVAPQLRAKLHDCSPAPVPVPVPVVRRRKRKELLANPNGFAAFWSRYPKKLGKGNAEKAWNRLNPQNGLVETILASIEAHLLTPQWADPQYIPYPATFLNGKRWEDELVVKPTEAPPIDPKIYWRNQEHYLVELKAGRVHPKRRVQEWEPQQTIQT